MPFGSSARPISRSYLLVVEIKRVSADSHNKKSVFSNATQIVEGALHKRRRFLIASLKRRQLQTLFPISYDASHVVDGVA